MNYKIIKNRKELEEFIKWLPDLKGEDKYYVSLFARKKYNGTIGLKADKAQLKRFTSCKDRLMNKILSLEIARGLYTIDDLSINEESLALYITPNPRDMDGAVDLLTMEVSKRRVNKSKIGNINSLALSMIQISGTKGLIDVDVDLTPLGLESDRDYVFSSLMKDISEFINISAVSVINTHGGFHILINTKKVESVFSKKWYMGFSNLKTDYYVTTMNGDNMIPVPGCVQGGSYPRILLLNK